MIIITKRLIILALLALTCFPAASVLAQDKVVVIPLMEDATGPLAPVPKTGQTTSYRDGDDGTHQAGTAAPTPRFVNHVNGTVKDNMTGLIWLREGNCVKFGTIDGSIVNQRPWSQAVGSCNILSSGYCGLSDGSQSGDWRLPNRKELDSLIDLGQYSPALPPNCPLAAYTQGANYWSATTDASNSVIALYVNFYYGYSYWDNKTNDNVVRCVRSGQ